MKTFHIKNKSDLETLRSVKSWFPPQEPLTLAAGPSTGKTVLSEHLRYAGHTVLDTDAITEALFPEWFSAGLIDKSGDLTKAFALSMARTKGWVTKKYTELFPDLTLLTNDFHLEMREQLPTRALPFKVCVWRDDPELVYDIMRRREASEGIFPDKKTVKSWYTGVVKYAQYWSDNLIWIGKEVHLLDVAVALGVDLSPKPGGRVFTPGDILPSSKFREGYGD